MVNKRKCLEKIALSIPFFGKKKREFEDLYDNNWGKSPHDKPLEDERSILIGPQPDAEGNMPSGKFSTDKQVVPDSWIKWMENPGVAYKAGRFFSFGALPDTTKIKKIVEDPSDTVYKFMNESGGKLPSARAELLKTMADHRPPGVPDHIWNGMTNAFDYATLPITTGKEAFTANSVAGKALAKRISERFHDGMKYNLSTDKGIEVVAK